MAHNSRLANGSNFTSTIHHDTYPAIDSATKSDLGGKYVFITGASKGVGHATAIAFAKAGAAGIAIGARSNLSSLERQIQQAAEKAGRGPPKVVSVNIDVESRESIEEAIGAIQTTFPRIDILVNNAGYLEKFLPIVESDPDEWWKTWNVNIRGAMYLVTRAVLPFMLDAGGDKQIINLSSIGALQSRYGASSYQATKLAVLRFSEFINLEYADNGVIAYSCHPGGVMTELASNMPEQLHKILNDKPEMAGETIVWLTQRRREWLRGRYVSCNWDMPQLMSMKDEIVEKDLLKVRLAV